MININLSKVRTNDLGIVFPPSQLRNYILVAG